MGVDDFRDDFPMEKKEERVFDQYRFEVFSPIAEKECQQLVRLGFLLDLGKGRFSFTEKMKKYWADFINLQRKFHSDIYDFLNSKYDVGFLKDTAEQQYHLTPKQVIEEFVELPLDLKTMPAIEEFTKAMEKQTKFDEEEWNNNHPGKDDADKILKHAGSYVDKIVDNFKLLGEKGTIINNPETSYVFPVPAKMIKAEEKRTKKFFYDTEFLEGPQKKRFLGIPYGDTAPTIDLISIGIVSDSGKEYYAVSKDFNLWEAWNRYDLAEQTNYEKANGFSGRKTYWIRENVLYPIFYDLFKKHNKMEVDDYFGNLKNFIGDMERDMKRAFKKFKSLISLYGKSRKQIAEEVQEFIIPKKGIHLLPIELWGYYSDYDHVVFCWLFGKMLDLPDGFPMYTKDLKQSYDFYNKNFKKRKSLNAVMPHLIDFENLKDHPDYPKQENEHNALSDARWNKKFYEFLKANK